VEEAVYYKESADAVYVKATGHVTALVCPPLKARIFGRIDRDPPPACVQIELSECEYMDSTFLGLIVGTHKRLCQRPQGASACGLKLYGVNEACRGLLRTIGVLGIVEIAKDELDLPADMERLAGGERATARFLLDAHEDLSELSADNRKRFSALTSVLRSAVESEDGKH
jgi:anti-anti-sigma regulatory factor